jgi:hypothetical protein
MESHKVKLGRDEEIAKSAMGEEYFVVGLELY